LPEELSVSTAGEGGCSDLFILHHNNSSKNLFKDTNCRKNSSFVISYTCLTNEILKTVVVQAGNTQLNSPTKNNTTLQHTFTTKISTNPIVKSLEKEKGKL